jgi:hypothetical protein
MCSCCDYSPFFYVFWFGFDGGACWTVTLADNYTLPFTDLLKNKSRPENAAEGAAAWVISERALREKLKKEREAKDRELEKEVRAPCPALRLGHALIC